MSATGRSYKQNLLKVQYIIIEAILGRMLTKIFKVTDEKIFRVYNALAVKSNSHTDLRTFHAQLSEKGCQYRKTPKIKFYHKKSTLLVKKSR